MNQFFQKVRFELELNYLPTIYLEFFFLDHV